MAKTNKTITYLFLDSYFLESNNQINSEYLTHMIKCDYIDNNRRCHDLALYSSSRRYASRRRLEGLTHEIILYALNSEIKFTDYSSYYVSSRQLKSWLEDHGESWSIFQPVLEYIQSERNEMKEG